MRRRDFINKFSLSAGALVAAGITGCDTGAKTAQEQTTEKSTSAKKDTTAEATSSGGIQTYNTIGSTEFKMSDISMGCGALTNPYTVDHAIDVGINYFDTAPDYGSGGSEEALGKVFAESSKRDKCIIVSKFCEKGRYGVHLDRGTPQSEIFDAVEGSLKRLNTDRIEFMMVHAIGERKNDRERLMDEDMLAAVTKLKEQGKILHLATSSHGPNNMEDLLILAIESGHYDMIMPAMNFMEHPRLTEVLAKAKEHKVGVVAMKTLAGAKEEDLSRFREGSASLSEAAFKWVFTQPAVNGLVVTMKSEAQIDEYVAASGKRFSAVDRKLLDDYMHTATTEYCRTGCGDCESYCPHGVAVASILRYDMYFTSYNEHLKALREYRELPSDMKPGICAECDGPCTHGCRFGLPVRARVMDAARRLEFA